MYLWQRKKLIPILTLTNLVVVSVVLLLQWRARSELSRASEFSTFNAEAANQLIEDSKKVLAEFDEGSGNPEALRQMRQQIEKYAEGYREREAALQRSKDCHKATLLCLLINISLTFAIITQQRTLNKPLEISDSKHAQESPTHHNTEA